MLNNIVMAVLAMVPMTNASVVSVATSCVPGNTGVFFVWGSRLCGSRVCTDAHVSSMLTEGRDDHLDEMYSFLENHVQSFSKTSARNTNESECETRCLFR